MFIMVASSISLGLLLLTTARNNRYRARGSFTQHVHLGLRRPAIGCTRWSKDILFRPRRQITSILRPAVHKQASREYRFWGITYDKQHYRRLSNIELAADSTISTTLAYCSCGYVRKESFPDPCQRRGQPRRGSEQLPEARTSRPTTAREA
jgi:hypothetical protein